MAYPCLKLNVLIILKTTTNLNKTTQIYSETLKLRYPQTHLLDLKLIYLSSFICLFQVFEDVVHTATMLAQTTLHTSVLIPD